MLIEVETIEEYMAALPENRKEAVKRLHQVIVEQLPAGFEVGILGGMINYYVPLTALMVIIAHQESPCLSLPWHHKRHTSPSTIWESIWTKN
ncbi:hypothetical protein [Streptococcus suis]|uniref:Uncharacterized protein n=1 Tax=Streptococcus suis TaxID=1307 RepID=A0AAW5LTM6_STRSU|nr:hypothetical protein [Streptococcus suis]MCR1233201.1 hypothetical protein [Streptococcus suis]